MNNEYKYTIRIAGRDVEVSQTSSWIAQDNNGAWWEFKRKPICGEFAKLWYARLPDVDISPPYELHLVTTKPPKDFTKQIYVLDWSKAK